MTIAGFINRWAPLGDHNPTAGYAQFVADACGVGVGDAVDVTDPEFLADLVSAVVHFEDGGDFCTPNQIEAALGDAVA